MQAQIQATFTCKMKTQGTQDNFADAVEVVFPSWQTSCAFLDCVCFSIFISSVHTWSKCKHRCKKMDNSSFVALTVVLAFASLVWTWASGSVKVKCSLISHTYYMSIVVLYAETCHIIKLYIYISQNICILAWFVLDYDQAKKVL